ncbi:MAG TPA: hypothetical protein VNR87_16275 [Flavisolibacter sp.]|nr:hypothetical protein [Flavisolibacter sp.]
MKRNLVISFACVIIMIIVMRILGHSLVTPVSARGIIDLEFARTEGRLNQLRVFWNPSDINNNIYVDFVFIAAYGWFFVTACLFIKSRTNWSKWSNSFSALALSAAFFDVCENFLMLLVLNGRFNASVLQIVFYCALIKFVLIGCVVLFILGSLPFALTKKQRQR